ncbi:MAG: LuxR C-terminal-related transcriptional regulator [Candidatus Promineifilaceae bacterium]
MVTFNTEQDYLLQTKLYPPRVPELLVQRQALVSRINGRHAAPVTLISAPAGYGKSTLVSQWLSASGMSFAWLSLDEYDRRLDIFVRYLVGAIQTVVPGFGRETLNLLELARLPSPERLAEMLLFDLNSVTETFFLVLDDYHTVAEESIHRLLIRLLQHLPPVLRLVIISRADPPLILPRLRGRGMLRELRGSDLRFSPEEAALLLQQIVGRPVETETVNIISEHSEGWPVALRMAAMSLRAEDDPGEFTRRYAAGGQKLVSDYLLGEVLEHMPDDQRDLLLRTAVVDRLCAPLVEVLSGDAEAPIKGHDFLEGLWSANFFLIALDVQGTWYRYHHLFRELLLQQLHLLVPEREITAMHLEVSSWFAKAGYIEEAILHALEAGRPQIAAKLVEDNVHRVMNQEEWRRIDRWLALLPDEARARPGILAIQVMIAQIRYQLEAMISLIDAAHNGLQSAAYDYTPQEREAWMGVLNACRASTVMATNTPQDSLRYAVLGLKQLEARALYVRSLCELWHVLALQQSGEPRQALRVVRRKLARQAGPTSVRTGRLMLAYCGVFYAEADLAGLRGAAVEFLYMAQRIEHPLSYGWANFFLGWCAYQENRLQEALDYFSRLLEDRYRIHVRAALDGISGIALTYGALGDRERAAETIHLLRDYIMEQGAIRLVPIADSLAVRLHLENPRGDALPGRADQAAGHFAADLWEMPLLTACLRELDRPGEQRLAAVEQTLALSRESAQSRCMKRQLLRIGGLQTLLHHARGEHELALLALREAVLLGVPGGTLRVFVDLGTGLVPYLKTLRDQGTAIDYINRILAAYRPGEVCEPVAAPPLPAPVPLLADLTNREMDVLLLLAQRLTNKEIAAELHISPLTVKKHAISLYQKLHVENRRQAAARAREAGII